MKIKIIVIKKCKAGKKNPSVNEAWQNDKNDCNRHRCKGSRYWLVALPWSLRIAPAGLAANQCAPKAPWHVCASEEEKPASCRLSGCPCQDM